MSEAATTAPAAPRSRLYAALAKAQGLCRAAELDGEFKTSKVAYPYTSINERLAVARDAFRECGLALVRAGLPRLVQLAVEVVDRTTGEATVEHRGQWMLEQDMLLTHESGEAHETGFRWPVIPQEPFRPLDKAVAAADTSGLSYLLRDVLLMPSEDSEASSDGETEARRSGPAQIGAPRMPTRPAPPAEAPQLKILPSAPNTTLVSQASPAPAPQSAEGSPPAGNLLPAGASVSPTTNGQELAPPAGEQPRTEIDAYVAAMERSKVKLASAPFAAAKLYAIQPDHQDKALYLDVFAVAEKRFGSRESAISTFKELGVQQGTVPTVAQLRKFVEVMP